MQVWLAVLWPGTLERCKLLPLFAMHFAVRYEELLARYQEASRSNEHLSSQLASQVERYDALKLRFSHESGGKFPPAVPTWKFRMERM